jgi:GT2 family glycosyltransferase
MVESEPKKLLVSIIIPTYHRANLLADCLSGLALQRPQNVDFEVLVVDNGDDDGATKRVVEAQAEIPRLRYLQSHPPGVSQARNVGLENALGDISVFLDDDEVPHRGWLTAITEPFALEDPKVDIVCGGINPVWESPRPAWLHDRYLSFFSAGVGHEGKNAWSDEPRVMTSKEWLLEGNCAIRTALVKEAGGFNTDLGRANSSLVSGEGDVLEELRRSGAVAFSAPKALVDHLIHSDRLSKDWLIQRIFAQGVTKAITMQKTGSGMPIPNNVAVNLAALNNKEFKDLAGEELLITAQIFQILGFICKKKGLL